MAGELAIRVEGLGKRYRLGQRAAAYRTLREALVEVAHAPFRRARRRDDDTLWALRDVSLEVRMGEVMGVIGRNGAGKTTLLKVLSRITEPTLGRVELYGRLGTLLEVGTGFHPELTGRENIYLNGAILGMRKGEIDRKFDEIVAFAEVERFLDTPVKRYSSGMYVRLAFAVAAHLEPEILLVDEVLAVGDLRFQRKCLGKMSEVVEQGRAVVFVTHQMTTVRRLCQRCIWIDGGRTRMEGPVKRVVSAYEADSLASPHDADRAGGDTAPARFLGWEVASPRGEERNWLENGLGTVTFRFLLRVNRPLRDGHHGIGLRDREGLLVWGWAKWELDLEVGVHELTYTLPSLPLRPGAYTWSVSLYDADLLLDYWDCSPELVVASEPLSHPRDDGAGLLNIPCRFSHQPGGDPGPDPDARP